VAAVGLAGVLGATAAVLVQARSVRCTGAEDAWSSAWNADTAAAVTTALEATGHAGAADSAARVDATLSEYGEQWVRSHRDACEANARGEQSDDLLDRRMRCLEVRAQQVRVLAEALGNADRATVDKAVIAARGVSGVAACDDAEALLRARPLPEDPGVRAEILALEDRLGGADVLESLGQHVAADAAYNEVRDRARELGDKRLQAMAIGQLAERSVVSAEGRDLLYEMLYLSEAAGFAEGELAAWTDLIRVHPYLGEYDAAERAARHASALVERMGEGAEASASIAEGIGTLHLEKGELDKAAQEMTRAIELLTAADPESPNVGVYWGNLGNVYALMDDNERALDAYERAHEMLIALLGPTNRTAAHMLMNLGRMEARMERYDESNSYYEEALAIMAAAGPEKDQVAITILNNLGQNYGDQGHYPEAIATIEQAIAQMEGLVGPKHRVLVRMRRGLSEVYLDARDLPRAIAEAEHALAVSVGSFGEDHLETSATRRRLGRILIAADRVDDALPLLERAVADEAKKDAPARQKALSLYWLATALDRDAKTRPRARELARAALPGLREGEPRDRRRAEQVERWLAGEGTLGAEDR
jgi:tetratricopeptide (TPR) repeat protein